MALDPPITGQVIAYPYLWSSEQQRGVDEGLKIRPVAVVATSERAGRTHVYVMPFTRTPPYYEGKGIEVPPDVKSHLNFSDQPAWIRTGELNHFDWPGPGIPGKSTEEITYGHLPYASVLRLREMLRDRVNEKHVALVDRDINNSKALQELSQSIQPPSFEGTANSQAVEDARSQGRAWQQRRLVQSGEQPLLKSNDRGLGR